MFVFINEINISHSQLQIEHEKKVRFFQYY
jgi:hypothetical protein